METITIKTKVSLTDMVEALYGTDNFSIIDFVQEYLELADSKELTKQLIKSISE